jgi:hypothetical protein
MLHFDAGFPGHCWTGGADWLLYPLLEYYQVTGDQTFLRDKLGPALMELALFYEDFLTRTDANGDVVFVPSFSMESSPASTGVLLAINATGDIQAGKHALRTAIDAANALGVEQGSGQGVARWTAAGKVSALHRQRRRRPRRMVLARADRPLQPPARPPSVRRLAAA